MPREMLVDALAGVMEQEGGLEEGLEFVQDQVDTEWRSDESDYSRTPSVSRLQIMQQ